MTGNENHALINRRKKLGLSPPKVAELVGVTSVAFRNYEAGRRTPSVLSAIKIAKALGTTVETLWSPNQQN